MSIEDIGLIRMIHRHGGPPRELRAFKNGNTLFVYWPLNGLMPIIKSSGLLNQNRKGPWQVHPDDLKRILGLQSPVSMRAKYITGGNHGE